jgi:hypothetical protein
MDRPGEGVAKPSLNNPPREPRFEGAPETGDEVEV